MAELQRYLDGIDHLLLVSGSVSRGTAGPRSDVDLLCIFGSETDRMNFLSGVSRARRAHGQYGFIRVAIPGTTKTSIRLVTRHTVTNLFRPSGPAVWVWRDVSSRSVTNLPEVRITRDGQVTTHPWLEKYKSSGYVRELARFDPFTLEPVATTEASMLISGQVLSKRALDDEVRGPVWAAFGLPLSLEFARLDPRFQSLADPRSTLVDTWGKQSARKEVDHWLRGKGEAINERRHKRSNSSHPLL